MLGQSPLCDCDVCARHREDTKRLDAAEASVTSLTAQLEEARRENVTLKGDLEAAAGECLIPIPEPGTDLAKVCIVNRILKRELAASEGRERELRERIAQVRNTVYETFSHLHGDPLWNALSRILAASPSPAPTPEATGGPKE